MPGVYLQVERGQSPPAGGNDGSVGSRELRASRVPPVAWSPGLNARGLNEAGRPAEGEWGRQRVHGSPASQGSGDTSRLVGNRGCSPGAGWTSRDRP
jgi:hypothetical protein